MTDNISRLFNNDAQRIEPNLTLRSSLLQRMRAKPRSSMFRTHPLALLGGFCAITVAAIGVSLTPRPHDSFIAQAQAAYGNLRTQLDTPGAVRHTITLMDSFTSEMWTNADGTQILSGMTLGKPDTLSLENKLYLPRENAEEMQIDFSVGSGGVITSHDDGSWSSSTFSSNDEDTSGHYSVTTPADTASWMERYDPEDTSVACVDITPLTDDQKSARETLNALNAASEDIGKGLSGPEAILHIVSQSPNAEDLGIETDTIVGSVHVYRVSYDSVISGIDASEIGKRGFQDFGFSTDTYLLRLVRFGSISPDGIESTDNTIRILVDEILSQDIVGTDFFSPERLNFVFVPPDTNNPDSWPTFELHNGCYRRGATGIEWLNADEEAEARARIHALGDEAPSTGGGGF